MNVNLKQDGFRAEAEMTHMHNKCFNVCVSDIKSDALNMDEVRCLDKCCWKYLQVHKVFSNGLNRAMVSASGMPADGKRQRR